MKRPAAIAFALMMVFGIVLAACAPAAAPAPIKAVETKIVEVPTEAVKEVPTKVVVTKDAVVSVTPTSTPALPGKSQGTPTSPAAAADKAVFPFVNSPLVAQLISEVNQNEVYSLTGYLSGELPLAINGQTYSFQTRNTYSEDILPVTQYVHDFLQARGVSAGYRDWSGEDEYGEPVSGRSVIGVITGTVRPTEIVLAVAHLDNMPEEGRAPGADDNASGSVGAMLAAARLAGHQFDRTVRFLFTTDEENEGISASTYVQAVQEANENIVAVYNLDMIGWDGNHDGVLGLETRYVTSTGYASDLAIAHVFTQVVSAYGLSALHPAVDAINDDAVDSAVFWDNGFAGITVIEDFGAEENPNYHTENDNLASLNMPFFTSFVKASVGTLAHLAIPIE